MAEKEHNITAIQIQEKMEERGVGISVEIVRRHLRKSGGKVFWLPPLNFLVKVT
ncbi:786_t:CDS:2 [Funneliformis geosporum]|uniref:786_t:CDS:1 n=1 Tax=Funneliformis geosporum TaxID=1117311 RepID=A0A9W4X1V2_9GLOM|nr:786_t:CDS:2 [Funneliformis geosporum]